jgi:hypothetical protein
MAMRRVSGWFSGSSQIQARTHGVTQSLPVRHRFANSLPNPISCHPRSGAELVRFRNADTRPQAGATGDVLAIHSMNAGVVTIGNRQGIANQGTSAIAVES